MLKVICGNSALEDIILWRRNKRFKVPTLIFSSTENKILSIVLEQGYYIHALTSHFGGQYKIVYIRVDKMCGDKMINVFKMIVECCGSIL